MNQFRNAITFNLPYNQNTNFWLAIFLPQEQGALTQALVQQGFGTHTGYVCKSVAGEWASNWEQVRKLIEQHKAEAACMVSLVSSDQYPAVEELYTSRITVEQVETIAASLWLGQAMLDDQVVTYMQPVIDKRGKVFGYEAFARVEVEGGAPIGGGKIIEASRGLNAQYALDRYLHVKAVKSFIESDLEGFLFINFVPGFIHRPEKYLEGLSDAARFHGMPSKHIVLDFTRSEAPSDLTQMKAIFDYCRSKGYSLSLDDISSGAQAKKILDAIRPDFLKLDIGLVRSALGVQEQRIIAELVELAHISGVTVAAEGVESEEIHAELLRSGVDLFQGYLFSPPVALSTLKKAVS